MRIVRFEQLDAWREAHQLVLSVYRVTRRFPLDERYALATQMRRAAVSVAANIAEGFKRRTVKDKSHFYNISQGSLEEVRYYFILCRDLNYPCDFSAAEERIDRVGRLLHGLDRSTRLRSRTS